MPFPRRRALKDMHLRTVLQILELWNYISSYPACADLPILRAVMAEHRDFLRSLETAKVSGPTRLSITKQSLSAESFAHPPQLNFLRDRIFQVVGRVRDAWAAILSRPHDVDLLNLQGSMACYDSLLSDLEGQQRLAAEDAVIHVKIKRRRSPSPQSSRKRRNGGEQSTDIVSSQALRIPRNQHYRDDMFRGLLAMSYGQINRPDAITQPREGELYFAYRKQSQRWLVALLLPLAGASAWGTLGSLGLLKSLPEPLTFDPDAQQLKWRDGYEDGGPLSSKQEFPVAFFAGPNFPDKSAVGWVTAEELRVLNESCLNPSVIPHWRAVRTFLERRAVSRALQDRIGLSPSLSDTYTDGSNGPIEHGQDAFLTSETTATKSSTIGSEDRPQLVSREIWSSLYPLPSNLNTAQAHSTIAVGHANASPEPVLPENYYLPRIDDKKREIYPPSLPRLRDIHMNVPGTRFGLFEWPVAVPQRILDLLAKKSEFAGIKPLPKDFSNSRGLFCCPLCPKIKQFVRLTPFSKHLWKH